MNRIATRTWAYGTRRHVKVIEQSRVNGTEMLMVQDLTDSQEAFVLVQVPGPDYSAGEKGTIEFTQGGPPGGYWRFTLDGQERRCA